MGWKGVLSSILAAGAIIGHGYFIHNKPEVPDVPALSTVSIKRSVRKYGDIRVHKVLTLDGEHCKGRVSRDQTSLTIDGVVNGEDVHFTREGKKLTLQTFSPSERKVSFSDGLEGHVIDLLSKEEVKFDGFVVDFRNEDNVIMKSLALPVCTLRGRYGEFDLSNMEFEPWEYREYYENERGFSWLRDYALFSFPALLAAGWFGVGLWQRSKIKDNEREPLVELSLSKTVVGALGDIIFNYPLATGTALSGLMFSGLLQRQYTPQGLGDVMLYGGLWAVECVAMSALTLGILGSFKRGRMTNGLRLLTTVREGYVDPAVFDKECGAMYVSEGLCAMRNNNFPAAARAFAKSTEVEYGVIEYNGLSFLLHKASEYATSKLQKPILDEDSGLLRRMDLQLRQLRNGDIDSFKEHCVIAAKEIDTSASWGLQGVLLEKAGLDSQAEDFKTMAVRQMQEEGKELLRIGESRRKKYLVDDVFWNRQGVYTKYETEEEAWESLERAAPRFKSIDKVLSNVATPRLIDTVFTCDGFYTFENHLRGEVLADALEKNLEPTMYAFAQFLGKVHGRSFNRMFDFGSEIEINHASKIEERLPLLGIGEYEEVLREEMPRLVERINFFPAVNNFDSHKRQQLLNH
ncbi:MAG: hypothetical protein ACE5FT_06290, partial [Candidatus Nanoarchaeia archaeon]